MTRSGCPPQRTLRAADAIELWDPAGSAHIVDWRRLGLVAESRLHVPWALDDTLRALDRRLPEQAPHTRPRQVRWVPLRLDAAAAGWRWGLILDSGQVLPTRLAASWIERGAAPPQDQRAGTWWRITDPGAYEWAWFVAAGTLEVVVRRALHGTAPIPTAVHVARSQVRHDLLATAVDAASPGRPAVRLVVQDLGARNGPGSRWGCLLARDLDGAAALCA